MRMEPRILFCDLFSKVRSKFFRNGHYTYIPLIKYLLLLVLLFRCWVEIHQNFQAELGMQMDYSQMKSKWKRDYVDHKKPPLVPQGEPLRTLMSSDVIDQELALDSRNDKYININFARK